MPTVWLNRSNSDTGWNDRNPRQSFSFFGGGYNFTIMDGLNMIYFVPRTTKTSQSSGATIWQERTDSSTNWNNR